MAVAAVGAPPAVTSMADLPEGVTVVTAAAGRASATVVLGFVASRAELATLLPRLLGSVAPGGSLWVAWPKRASKVPTDLTDEVVRGAVLPRGWVDVKVCAIDDVWSGLRFVARRTPPETS